MKECGDKIFFAVFLSGHVMFVMFVLFVMFMLG